MTTAQTPAERQQARRVRLADEGFNQRQTWVHKSDEKRYKDFLKTLRKPDADAGHHKQH